MNTLTLDLTDQQKLSAAYMPFIKNGGLLVNTANNYKLGDTVTLNINLMNETEPYYFSGKIAWLIPNNNIGVQLNPEQNDLRHKIENYLGEKLND